MPHHIVVVKQPDGMAVIGAPTRLQFAAVLPLFVAETIAHITADGKIFRQLFAGAQRKGRPKALQLVVAKPIDARSDVEFPRMHITVQHKIDQSVGNALQFALIEAVDGCAKTVPFLRRGIGKQRHRIGLCGRHRVAGNAARRLSVFDALRIDDRSAVFGVFIEQIERKRHGIIAPVVVEFAVVGFGKCLFYCQTVQVVDGRRRRQRSLDAPQCQRSRIDPHFAFERQLFVVFRSESDVIRFVGIAQHAVNQKILIVERALRRKRTDEIGLQRRDMAAVEVDIRCIVLQKHAHLIGRQ